MSAKNGESDRSFIEPLSVKKAMIAAQIALMTFFSDEIKLVHFKQHPSVANIPKLLKLYMDKTDALQINKFTVENVNSYLEFFYRIISEIIEAICHAWDDITQKSSRLHMQSIMQRYRQNKLDEVLKIQTQLNTLLAEEDERTSTADLSKYLLDLKSIFSDLKSSLFQFDQDYMFVKGTIYLCVNGGLDATQNEQVRFQKAVIISKVKDKYYLHFSNLKGQVKGNQIIEITQYSNLVSSLQQYKCFDEQEQVSLEIPNIKDKIDRIISSSQRKKKIRQQPCGLFELQSQQATDTHNPRFKNSISLQV